MGELIGKYSFTEMLYFLTCDRMPDAVQVRLLDACLVTLMEHGLTPGAVIARLMADSVPEEPQVAIASGLLAIERDYAGTTESLRRAAARRWKPASRAAPWMLRPPIWRVSMDRASVRFRDWPWHAQTGRSALRPATADRPRSRQSGPLRHAPRNVGAGS